MHFARSRENLFFSLLFASNLSLPTKAKLKERIFALLRFQKIFVSLRFASFSFCFRFISISFRFRCENKRKNTFFVSKRKNTFRIEAKKHFFRIEAKKMSLPFRIISLKSENDGSITLPFRFISLRSENDGSFSLLFRFVFASFHSRFVKDFYVSHRSEKNFASVSLHFASKRKWRRTLVWIFFSQKFAFFFFGQIKQFYTYRIASQVLHIAANFYPRPPLLPFAAMAMHFLYKAKNRFVLENTNPYKSSFTPHSPPGGPYRTTIVCRIRSYGRATSFLFSLDGGFPSAKRLRPDPDDCELLKREPHIFHEVLSPCWVWLCRWYPHWSSLQWWGWPPYQELPRPSNIKRPPPLQPPVGGL